MANTTNILKALSEYTGEVDSLNNFVQVIQGELGDDWMNTITGVLPNLPQSLQQKLDHAMQYYGATSAWNELQSYLLQETSLDIDMVSQRIPTLAYWLDFFEDEGRQAVQSLKDRIEQQKEHPELFLTPEPVLQEEVMPQEETQPETQLTQEDVLLSEMFPSDIQNESAYQDADDEQSQTPLLDDEALTEIQDSDDIESSFDALTNNDMPLQSQEDIVYDSVDAKIEEQEGYQDEPMPQEAYQEESYQDEPMPQEAYQEANYQDEPMPQEAYQEEGYQDEPMPQEAYQEEGYQDESMPQEVYQEANYQDEPMPQEAYQEESYQDEPYLREETPFEQTEQIDDLGTEESVEQPAIYEEPTLETTEEFMAKKVFRQIDFLNQVRSWINARCIALGQIEIYSYKHYGFLIDIMEETKKDVQDILSNPVYYPAVEQVRSDGLTLVKNMLVSLEEDLKIAYDNLPSEATPLIDEDFDGSVLKSSLGRLDTSNQKEYLGPAPDGFEMIDDPYEEKKTVKSTLLKRPPLRTQGISSQSENQNNTSQTAQSGVQRKMSFSFNKKNPS